jgi:hypothetical protein
MLSIADLKNAVIVLSNRILASDQYGEKKLIVSKLNNFLKFNFIKNISNT